MNSSLFDHMAALVRADAMARLLDAEARDSNRRCKEPLEYHEFPEPTLDWRAEVQAINEGRS